LGYAYDMDNEHDFKEDPRTAAGLHGGPDSTDRMEQPDTLELLLQRIEDLERRVKCLEMKSGG